MSGGTPFTPDARTPSPPDAVESARFDLHHALKNHHEGYSDATVVVRAIEAYVDARLADFGQAVGGAAS